MPIRTFVFVFFGTLAILAHANPRDLIPYPASKQAPDFKLQDTQGKTHALGDYRGKVLIVNFWATWCSPCVKEMPSLQRAWQQLSQEAVEVLAINVGEDRNTIVNFIKTHPIGFPVLLDSSMSLTTTWSVKGLPTTYILDPQGQITFQVIGDLEWDDPAILQKVRALEASHRPR